MLLEALRQCQAQKSHLVGNLCWGAGLRMQAAHTSSMQHPAWCRDEHEMAARVVSALNGWRRASSIAVLMDAEDCIITKPRRYVVLVCWVWDSGSASTEALHRDAMHCGPNM